MEFCLLIPAAMMIVSDFRRREVLLWVLIVFGVACLAVALISEGWRAAVWNAVLNAGLLAYMGAGVMTWLRIRQGRWVNPLQGWLGAGDVLFMLALTPLFGLKEYLLFLIVSMAGSLVWWLAAGRGRTIPLVGTMGIALAIYLILKWAS